MAAAASVILLLTTPADAQYCTFSVGFGMHGSNANASAPAAVYGKSGYDPFVLDHSTGRFRYVPIPYDPEPPGSGYNPFRLNWHSGNFDYVPVPTELDYARWRAAAPDNGRRVNAVAGGAAGAGATGFMGTAQPVPPSALLAMDLSSMRATEATAVSRDVPVAPPPLPPRMMPQGLKSATTRPTLARPAGTARRDPAPPPQPSRGMKGPTGGDADGWTKMRGVTGRWDYDYQRGRWVFVLPSD